MKHFNTQADFFSKASDMRAYFEQHFNQPLEAHEHRFVWDNWFVKDRYHHMRTPAYHYFPEDLYKDFEDHLIQWGCENLGCQNISPPWLSYYVDGHYQNLHADIPHGPWAYVYSLTEWQNRLFDGGETMVLKPKTLSYWTEFSNEHGFEFNDLVDTIEPKFNQLTFFDPRFPHGVKQVEGVRDPLKGRLVIHGWFTEPSPTLVGDLDDEKASELLNSHLEKLHEHLSQESLVTGIVSFKMYITSSGAIDKVEVLFNNLINREQPLNSTQEIQQQIYLHLLKAKFPKAGGPSTLTVPFTFE